jgi:hypothetical protein
MQKLWWSTKKRLSTYTYICMCNSLAFKKQTLSLLKSRGSYLIFSILLTKAALKTIDIEGIT